MGLEFELGLGLGTGFSMVSMVKLNRVRNLGLASHVGVLQSSKNVGPAPCSLVSLIRPISPREGCEMS